MNEWRWLLVICAAGLAIRLALFWTDPHYADFRRFGRWATALSKHPLSSFYATTQSDHLPGDLWILWYVANFLHTLSPSLPVDLAHRGFLYVVRLVPSAFDLGCGVMAFLVARRLRPGAGVLAAALFVLNPAVIFLSGTWGQWDSVSAFFGLAAIWLFLRGNLVWALPALAYAALIKPQFLALAPLLLAVLPRRFPHWAWRAAAGLALSVALMVALLLPFNVGIGPIEGTTSLGDRITAAVDLYQRPTVSAFNSWAVWALPTHGKTDLQLHALGLTYRALGLLLAAAACAAIYSLYWRRRGSPLALLWASSALFLALFLFPTRVHERYLFGAIAFAAPLAAVHRPSRWSYGVLTATYAANLAWIYTAHLTRYEIFSLTWIRVVGAINVGVLAYLLLRAPPGGEWRRAAP